MTDSADRIRPRGPVHSRYRVEGLLATGGMGEVWTATDTLLDRRVALKVLKREYAESELFRARFANEARVAAGVQHPHVAGVLDYGELDAPDAGSTPVPFLVMELVDGSALSALLAEGRALDPATAADLVAQAADGLAAAHARGVVHRDVKPGNLLVSRDGVVKVTDFGVARAAEAVTLTVAGQVVGTPHYLSPEQARGEPATAASDVYSLGVVLYECLAGARPFTGESPVAIALQQINDPLPPLPASVPAHLRSAVEAATRKDPDHRLADATAFAGLLRDAAPDTQVLPAATAGEATRTMAAVAAAPPVLAPAPPPRRRRPGLVPALLAAGVVLVAGVWWAGAVAGSDPEPPGAAPDTPSDSPAPSASPSSTPRATDTATPTATPTASPTATTTTTQGAKGGPGPKPKKDGPKKSKGKGNGKGKGKR